MQPALDFVPILETIDSAIVVVDTSLRVLFWNRAAELLFAVPAAEALGRTTAELLVLRFVGGTSRAEVLRALYAQGSWSGEVLVVQPDGRETLIEVRSWLIRDAGGAPTQIVNLAGDVSARQEARQAQARLRVLADASQRFASATTDLQTLFRAISEYIAATIGDLCSLRVLSSDGTQLVTAHIAHVDPRAAPLIDAIGQALQPVGELHSGRVVQTGQPLLIAAVPQERFRASVPPLIWPYLDQFGVTTLLIVPLLLHGRPIGALTLARGYERPPYTVDDQTMCQEIADRAALAIDYARAYADERRARADAEAALATRNEAFALLDTLFATAPIGLAFVDRELRFKRINIALAEINGIPADDHFGHSLTEVLPTLAPLLVPIYEQVLTTSQPITNIEISGETPAEPGRQRQWLASYYPVLASEVLPIGVGVVVVEISERVEAEAALREREQRLRQHADDMHALSVRLVHAQEDERRALARELHDEIGQLLTGLNMVLEATPDADLQQLQAKMHTAQQVITDLTSRVRQLSLDLRPSLLDDLGLLPTLLWHLRRYSEQTQIGIDFKHSGLDITLPPHVAIAAYRIVQEGLTNIARYALVSAASVRVWVRQRLLTIAIEDDGCGFDVEAAFEARRSVGLQSMRERALLLGGQFLIDSAAGEGTRIVVTLPLDGPQTTTEEGA